MATRKRQKLCPQCKIGRFHVQNAQGERLLVTVDENGVINPVHLHQSVEGFDLNTLYCLGCSWKGSTRQLL